MSYAVIFDILLSTFYKLKVNNYDGQDDKAINETLRRQHKMQEKKMRVRDVRLFLMIVFNVKLNIFPAIKFKWIYIKE